MKPTRVCSWLRQLKLAMTLNTAVRPSGRLVVLLPAIQPLPPTLSENERGAERARMDGSSLLENGLGRVHGGAWSRSARTALTAPRLNNGGIEARLDRGKPVAVESDVPVDFRL